MKWKDEKTVPTKCLCEVVLEVTNEYTGHTESFPITPEDLAKALANCEDSFRDKLETLGWGRLSSQPLLWESGDPRGQVEIEDIIVVVTPTRRPAMCFVEDGQVWTLSPGDRLVIVSKNEPWPEGWDWIYWTELRR